MSWEILQERELKKRMERAKQEIGSLEQRRNNIAMGIERIRKGPAEVRWDLEKWKELG